jgi:hypothetical protein
MKFIFISLYSTQCSTQKYTQELQMACRDLRTSLISSVGMNIQGLNALHKDPDKK